MDLITVTITKDLYASVDVEIREQMLIQKVEDPDFDYSDDENWRLLKKEARKAYKALKEREHYLKHS